MNIFSLLSKSFIFIKLWNIKSQIMGLLFPIALVWILTNEYKDYIDYCSTESYLGTVYIAKWSIIIFSFLIFYIRLKKDKPLQKQSKSKQSNTENSKEVSTNDRFDYLRNKDTLETKADKILKGKDYE